MIESRSVTALRKRSVKAVWKLLEKFESCVRAPWEMWERGVRANRDICAGLKERSEAVKGSCDDW